MNGPEILADPRARWLLDALRVLYDRFDDDATPVALSVVTLSGTQIVTYGVNACDDEVTVLVTDVADLGTIEDALHNGDLSDVVTDATVRDGPP